MRTLFLTWFGLLGLRREHFPDSLPPFDTVRQAYQPTRESESPFAAACWGGKAQTLHSPAAGFSCIHTRGYSHERNLSKNESEPEPAEEDHGAPGNAREDTTLPCQSLEQAFDRIQARGHHAGLFPRSEMSFARRTLRLESLRQRRLARFLSAYARSAPRDRSSQAAQLTEHLAAFGRDRVLAKRTCARPDVPRLCGT